MQVKFEGKPKYDNEANDYYREWASIITEDDSFDLLEMLRATTLSTVDEVCDWPFCKIRITIEVLELKQAPSSEPKELSH